MIASTLDRTGFRPITPPVSTCPVDTAPDLFPELEALRSGEEAAWEAGWRQAFPPLLSIARQAAQTSPARLAPDQVEEVATLAVTLAARQVRSVKTVEHLKKLVFVISRCRAISLARTCRSNVLSLEEAGADLADPGCPGAGSPSPLELAELAVLLDRAMGTLDPLDRALLVDQNEGGLSYRELALKHGLLTGTVGSRIGRALGKIQRELGKHPRLVQELSEFLR